MHWRRKLGIGMLFVFMPAMAPLWAMLGEAVGIWPVEWGTPMMIRVLAPLFVIALIITLGSKELDDSSEVEE
jgi:hypothetical protein